MAKWEVLTQVPIAASLQNVVDAIDDIVNTISTALNLVVAALEVVKALAFLTLNLLKAIVEAVLALIEELIFDLLEFNIAFAFHTNINWSPYWVYNKEKERDPRTGRLDPRLFDFANDGVLPWGGSGLTGWLLDILASSKDPTDPFRPVTDDSTKVRGLMIIKGFANPQEIEQSLGIEDWVDLFTNWKGFKFKPERIRTDPYMESVSKLVSGAVLDTLLPLYQLGPKENQFLSLKEAIVGNPLDSYVSDFVPVPGNYPKWVSVPMAAVVPPLQNLFANLQKLLGLLSFSDDLSDALAKLIQAIEDKINLLLAAIREVQDIIDFLIAFAAFLTDSYIITLETAGGGMDTFIADILGASDAPDFGTAGIVLGVTMISTNPDASVAFDKFWQILGIQTSLYSDTVTGYAEGLDQTFNDLF